MTHSINRQQIMVLAGIAVLMIAAHDVRISWVEDPAIGFACETADSLACSARQALVTTFHYHLFGWAAVIVGALSIARPCRALAAAGLVLGGLGLTFYNVDPASLGAVLALIGLARSAPRPLAAPEAG